MKIAIITARGGSRRIPGKNIRAFCGKPILTYSIEAALESGLFDTVMVSTDDGHIADIAREAGAEVPFLRSAETSDDYATTSDVLMEVLQTYTLQAAGLSLPPQEAAKAPVAAAHSEAVNAGETFAFVCRKASGAGETPGVGTSVPPQGCTGIPPQEEEEVPAAAAAPFTFCEASGAGEVDVAASCPYDIACCLYPTAPFVTAARLREGMQLLLDDPAADTVLPVVPFSFPPQRGVYIEGNRIVIADPESYPKRSQDLKKMYHDCGQFYIFRTAPFLSSGRLIGGHVIPLPLSELEVQDIDNETDWQLAEMKYRLLHETHMTHPDLNGLSNCAEGMQWKRTCT